MAQSKFAQYAGTHSWDEGNDFEDIPAGEYVTIFNKAEVKQSQADFWMLAVSLKILEAEDEKLVGRLVFLNLMFEGKNGWNPWKVKQFFKDMEIELPEFDQIEDAVKELVENKFGLVLELSYKNGFPNHKVNLIQPEDVPQGVGAGKLDKKPEGLKNKKAEAPAKEEPAPKGKMARKKKEEVVEKSEEEVQAEKDLVEKSEEEVQAEKDLEALKTFATEGGADLEEGADLEALKEALGEYEFAAEDMSEEEQELFDRVGLEYKKPAPKKTIEKKKK